MKFLVDMNLSPGWVVFLQRNGWEAVHWSAVGNPKASDNEILSYAAKNQYIVLTHDLDFGSIIAATGADYPSVIQIRTLNVNPAHIGEFMISILTQFADQLETGSLIIVDKSSLRVRILPLKRALSDR